MKRKTVSLKSLMNFWRKHPLLPNFSCHTLRHTFATRMCEMGINLKVIQDVLGHSDFSTTMNVYTDATSDFKKKEFQTLEKLLKGGSAE